MKPKITYIIIPIEVFYNPKLTKNDCFLYWLIQSLQDQEKGCWATNKYFEDHLDLSTSSVTNGINRLVDHGYITTSYDKNNMRQIRMVEGHREKYTYLIDQYNNKISMPPSPKQKETLSSFLGDINIIYNNPISKEIGGAHAPSGILYQNCVYPKETKELLDYWNNLLGDILPKTKETRSKACEIVINAIDLSLKRGYTQDEIADSMGNYHSLWSRKPSRLDKNISGHYVGMNRFFKFDDFTKAKIKSNKNNIIADIVSWFDECLNGLDYLIDKYVVTIENDCPDTTAKIKRLWNESPYYIGTPTVADENNFRKAAHKLNDWLDVNKNRYDIISDDPVAFVARYLFPALKDSLGNSDPKIVTTAWLASDAMFARRVHLYMVKKGLFLY